MRFNEVFVISDKMFITLKEQMPCGLDKYWFKGKISKDCLKQTSMLYAFCPFLMNEVL